MRIEPYLCLGGTELANARRSMTYVQQGFGDSRMTASVECTCEALEDAADPFISPVTDPAPWYDEERPESDEFLGLYAHTVRLLSPINRDVNRRRGAGGVLSPIGLSHRLVTVQGTMFAATAAGMYYGERWVTEVLRGSICQAGCASDELIILPACPGEGSADPFVRRLYNVGIIDGPDWVPIRDLPECVVQEVRFQLAAEMPWLYRPRDLCIDVALGYQIEETCQLSTASWPGDATLRITLTADDIEVTDLIVTGTVMVDGTCPPAGDAENVPPCFSYSIPSIPPNGELVIDGTRQSVIYNDPITRTTRAGFPYLEVEGLFDWPDMGPCTELCLSVTNNGGTSVNVLVEKFDREL